MWSVFVRFVPQWVSLANLKGSQVHKSTKGRCSSNLQHLPLAALPPASNVPKRVPLTRWKNSQETQESFKTTLIVTCSSGEPPNIWASHASTYLRSATFSPLLSRLQPRKEKLLPLWESEQRLGGRQKRLKKTLNLKSNLSLHLGFRRLRTIEAPARTESDGACRVELSLYRSHSTPRWPSCLACLAMMLLWCCLFLPIPRVSTFGRGLAQEGSKRLMKLRKRQSLHKIE